MVLYAVVDVETTGLSSSDKIIEIAIVITDGSHIIEDYTTLVNPEMTIPQHIIDLTGIQQSDVDSAPTFSEICDEVFEMINGKTFVAHNAAFDLRMVKSALARCGITLDVESICTMQLAKTVFPSLRSYKLGIIASYLDINIGDAHRALHDTIATAELFHILRDESRHDDALKTVEERRASVEAELPPQCEGILKSGLNHGKRCKNNAKYSKGTKMYCGIHIKGA